MVNVLAIIPNTEDATGLYRSTAPLAELSKRDIIRISHMPEVGENRLEYVDMVFMQRPFTNDHRKIAQMAVDNGIPLWVDHDDLLFQVPMDNPSYNTYMNKQVIKNVTEIIAMANAVTVSTHALKRALQPPKAPLNRNVFVVPNALSAKFLRLAKPYEHKKHINWRGTDTHMRDLAEYAEPLILHAKRNMDTTFTFLGYNPWFITGEMRKEQAVVVPPMTVGDYFRFISATNPPVQICPLHDSLFNRCKSNIAWLEATLAGGVCIGPDWEEWHKPGMLTYNNDTDFAACLELAMTQPQKMKEFHAMSWDYIRKNLMVHQVNEIREQVINALVNGSPIAGGAPTEDRMSLG